MLVQQFERPWCTHQGLNVWTPFCHAELVSKGHCKESHAAEHHGTLCDDGPRCCYCILAVFAKSCASLKLASQTFMPHLWTWNTLSCDVLLVRVQIPIFFYRLISDTRSQGYTDLQNWLKCLDHRGGVLMLDTVCSQARVVLGCAMH